MIGEIELKGSKITESERKGKGKREKRISNIEFECPMSK